MLSDLNHAFETLYLLYFFVWNLMQPQMVFLQHVETRKWDAIEFFTFAWIFVDSSPVNCDTDQTDAARALFSASVCFTQTFDGVSIKGRNDTWFAYLWLWGLLTSIFTTNVYDMNTSIISTNFKRNLLLFHWDEQIYNFFCLKVLFCAW